ncbi:EcsC family protein [Nocardioides jiangxiensis]|uniref:EcsC family protein n=1 Tax=Nocardioides jiangxiensis TaxID=3064524 RepID=A0ABT9B4S1_9ACTN|nr:EcsC family protein [Nocardioides sp. WY-20]MDO7868306.1 EcsC family protein [Nocardioides sp. WY-20]
MGLGSIVGRRLAPRVQKLVPNVTHNFVREAMDKAITGVGPLRPAVRAAEKQLADEQGDAVAAAKDIVRVHVAYASAQGFVTNIGGLMTAIAAVPANITGLTLIQVRMIAEIAHVHGHDLNDVKVRRAVVTALLGEDAIRKAVKKKQLPGTPYELATGPSFKPELEAALSLEIATELITRVAGRRLATTVGKRVPVLGGVVGLTADGFATWQLGRYAAREFARGATLAP